MKLATLIAATALALVATAPAYAKDDHTAKHGGIFVETKALDFEIVAKPEVIQVFVADHGKQVKLEGAKAKVTLLNGAEKSEVELVPAADRFEAKGSFKIAKGTKGIASVMLPGKPAAVARFEVGR